MPPAGEIGGGETQDPGGRGEILVAGNPLPGKLDGEALCARQAPRCTEAVGEWPEDKLSGEDALPHRL